MGTIFSLLLFAFFFLIVFGLYALIYVGQALGTYRMMGKTGLPHAWTAWVPLCNYYALGAIADHQTTRNEGRDKHYRQKLLIWTIVFIAIFVLFFVAFIFVMTLGVSEDFYTSPSISAVEAARPEAMSLVFLLMIPLYAAEIVFMVYHYVVLHKIYKLFSPNSAVGLTVLSIFISAAIPIVLFVLSGNAPVYEHNDMDGYDFMPQPEEQSAEQTSRPSNTGRNIYS